MEKYMVDENGRVPKADDHNINALQYGLSALGLDFSEVEEKKPIPQEEPRGHRLEDEIGEMLDEYSEI